MPIAVLGFASIATAILYLGSFSFRGFTVHSREGLFGSGVLAETWSLISHGLPGGLSTMLLVLMTLGIVAGIDRLVLTRRKAHGAASLLA